MGLAAPAQRLSVKAITFQFDHELFGVDPAVAQELPDEVFGEGYLNTLSPLQTEL